jgi:hypothetical protein
MYISSLVLFSGAVSAELRCIRFSSLLFFSPNTLDPSKRHFYAMSPIIQTKEVQLPTLIAADPEKRPHASLEEKTEFPSGKKVALIMVAPSTAPLSQQPFPK